MADDDDQEYVRQEAQRIASGIDSLTSNDHAYPTAVALCAVLACNIAAFAEEEQDRMLAWVRKLIGEMLVDHREKIKAMAEVQAGATVQ